MRFELNIALKYLLPRKKSLSTALISLLSVAVISLVVWLVLVFLSVTTGMERNWIQKLTSLHAPLRITPTSAYYSSYYYQIDSLAASSHYTLKTIGEKAQSSLSDPYAEELDTEIPFYWPKADRLPNGQLKDPVKIALQELSTLQKEIPDLSYQDYEVGGALLRLTLHLPGHDAPSYLSQMSYLLSLTEENPRLPSLIAPLPLEEISQLVSLDPALIEHVEIDEIKPTADFRFPPHLLPLHQPIQGKLDSKTGHITILPQANATDKVTLVWDGQILQATQEGKPVSWNRLRLDPSTPLQVRNKTAKELHIQTQIQGHLVTGSLPFQHLQITQGNAKTHFDSKPVLEPAWAYFVQGKCHLPERFSETPLLLPKNYRESGVRLGDRGTLNYVAPTAVSAQEQRIAVRVVGFYDPGVLSVGNKCLILPNDITRAIHAASQTFSPDGTPTNGIFVWPQNLSETKALQKKLQERFEQAGIAPYWQVTTYEEFEFAKDLFLQFQSDRTLFLLIAGIILFVACCNIISLLVLLVNDKKKEIAILQAMGASFKSIAQIFGFCGILMGTVSCLIGSALAILTLKNLEHLVSFLSALQGHAAFNPAFFGKTLPNQLSYEALLFVLIATPLLSLAAGLIPALKASRIRPSSVLRSE